MRTLVHLSDLHFGRINYAILDPLIEQVRKIGPDLVAVSGDLTQRARTDQFKEARKFLDALPTPQIVVPGNHDVPLHNLFARFLTPLEKYRRYISDDLEPFYSDSEVLVLGINTARSLTIKDGRINERQVARIYERLCQAADEVTKIVVTHHPFEIPSEHNERDLVGRARKAMEMLAKCGADVLLAGHIHIGHTVYTAKRYKIAGHSALVVSAGTATSTRGRGEPNSFNIVRLDHPHIEVERLIWNPTEMAFTQASIENFSHTSEGWIRV